MDIGFFVDAFPKFSETFVLDQITGLIDRGHRVEIFARRDRNESQIHEDVRKYDLLSKTHYPDVPLNKAHRIVRAGKLVAVHLHGNPWRVLESLRIGKYGRDALSLRMLYSSTAFEECDFDVLYCHFGQNGNLGALLKQTGTNVPVVTAFHGYDVRRAIETDPGMYEPAFEYSALLLANSEATRKKLIDLGANPEAIVWHPVGIDPSAFSQQTNPATSDSADRIVLTTVSRLVKVKGHEYAIRAVADVIERNPNRQFEYRIVGGGRQRASLEKEARECGIAESVVFTGPVDHDSVRKHLNETDIFLLASLDEGLGTVLLEAQAARIPIVATDTGGIPEAVDSGNSALLVPPKDSAALAERIAYLCEHPEQWPEMGRAGREYVEERFHIDVLNDELEALFESLLAE